MSSDYSRRRALYIAAAASRGYITTEDFPNSYGRVWLATERGLRFLRGGVK